MKKPITKSPFLTVAVTLALSAASFSAWSQQSPALDRASIWVGGYYSNNDTTLSGHGRQEYSGLNGSVNFENDLGLEKHTTDPRVRADFLLGDSQGFSFDYYEIHRSNSSSYSTSVPVIGGDAGGSIKGIVNYNFGSASYKWWFGHASDVFGIGLGAAYYKVDLRVNGKVYGAGQTISDSTGYSDSEWAPMLTLGWRHAFNNQWRMYADASGVKKNGGDLNGSIWNASVGVEWFPWQNFGFALEYDASHLHLNKDYSDSDLHLRLRSDGPAFYLRARF